LASQSHPNHHVERIEDALRKGNQNQTTTWADCIAWYEDLAQRYPRVLRFSQIGTSDAGVPIHAGVVSSDGVFDRARSRRGPPGLLQQ
jgi:hypothetical protein